MADNTTKDDVKEFLEGLSIEDIPWHRMLTAYGTAKDYPELLETLKHTDDVETAKQTWNRLSDFEHQSTMCPPAPFALWFLVKLFEKRMPEAAPASEWISRRLIHQFVYYAEVCQDADDWNHAEPLDHIEELLKEKYLLPEICTEDVLDEYFEAESPFPDEVLYSNYYYSKLVLSQLPDLLDKNKIFPDESRSLRKTLLK